MEAKNDKISAQLPRFSDQVSTCASHRQSCVRMKKKIEFFSSQIRCDIFFCPAVQINSIDACAFGLQTHGEIEKCRKLETVGVIAD